MNLTTTNFQGPAPLQKDLDPEFDGTYYESS